MASLEEKHFVEDNNIIFCVPVFDLAVIKVGSSSVGDTPTQVLDSFNIMFMEDKELDI